MKSRNMSFYITIGFTGLFIASFWFKIEPQKIAGLSITTLFFTIAQTLDSQINFWNEDLQNQVDIYNNVGDFNLSPKNLLLIKFISKYQTPPKKQKIMYKITTIIYGLAFIILFLTFVIPMNISEQVETSITILSSVVLFFSIWLVDKQQERKSQWNEVQMMAMMFKDIDVQAKNETNMEE